MIDVVVGVIVAAAFGLALAYIIRSGKRGECIGCPDAKNCHSHRQTGEAVSSCKGGCGSCTGCGCHTDVK